MKKSYLFKLLVLAVIAAFVTFTSCKDYDDDINDLNSRIDKLATKDDVTAQLNTLQTALNNAAKDATDALTKANAAETAAKAAADAAKAAGDGSEEAKAAAKAADDAAKAAQAAADKAATLAQLQEEVAKLKEELADANEEEFVKIREEVAKAAKKVEEAIGASINSVTSVQLVKTIYGFGSSIVDKILANDLEDNIIYLIESMIAQGKTIPQIVEVILNPDLTFLPILNFSTAIAEENVFATGMTNAITFNKGDQRQTESAFVIKVDPVSAVITPEMVALQNSLGEVLEDLEVVKVEPYRELLTGWDIDLPLVRSTTNGNGLWKVTVRLKDYDEDAFLAATKKDKKQILFAVAVNNTQSTALDRVVLSAYDVQLYWTEYIPEGELFFFVDETPVCAINNRWSGWSQSLLPPQSGYTATMHKEKEWKDAPATKATDANTVLVAEFGNDDRDEQPVYPAVQGKAMKISLSLPPFENGCEGSKILNPNNIRGMYVTLDYRENAVESAPSEWNAWNSYTYVGLNQVVEGTTHEIIINSDKAINDIIGFRVFAVNYDGTLVDPDGKAFYVAIGKEGQDFDTANTVVTAKKEDIEEPTITTTKSTLADVKMAKLDGAATYEWTTDEASDAAKTKPAFHAYFTQANGTTAVFNTSAASGPVPSGVDFSKAAKVYTFATVNDWLAYEDNKVYTGTLKIKNATGHVLATIKVTFKKVLPTVPAGFSVKTGQISADGVYYSYLVPNDWEAPNATLGTITSLSEVFNFDPADANGYETTFATSINDGKDPIKVTGNGTLEVEKNYIDNQTQHATKVAFNFGKISTAAKDNNGNIVDYVATVKEFPTVYSNIYNNTYSWNWATRAQLGLAADATLPYKTEVTYGAGSNEQPEYTVAAAHIYGKSTRDDKYSKLLSAPYLESLEIQPTGHKFVTKANGIEEYFTATYDAGTKVFTLEMKSDTTNPTTDVPSQLQIAVKDMYGNNITIKIDVLLKSRN